MTDGYEYDFGGAIRKVRKAAGVSQGRLANTIGMIQPHLCAVEKGHRATSLQTLVAVSEALEVPLVVLVYLATPPEECGKLPAAMWADVMEALGRAVGTGSDG